MSFTPITVQSNSSGWLLDPDTGQFGGAELLDAATTTGYSTVLDLGALSSSLVLSTVVTGSPTAVEVVIEGSKYDTSNWFVITSSQSATGEYIHVGGAVRYLRVHLLQLTGGTSPTVTAVVGAI